MPASRLDTRAIAERKITVHVPEDLLDRAQKSMVAFLEGRDGDDTSVIQSALEQQPLALPRAVLTELLSDPALPRSVRTLLGKLPLLDIEPGFWERAGLLRASILKQRENPRVADALIAQSCLDQSTPLVTRDRDFRHFAAAAGLPLL